MGQSFHFWKRSTYVKVLQEGHRIIRYITKGDACYPDKNISVIGKFSRIPFTGINRCPKKDEISNMCPEGMRNETPLISDLLIQMVLWSRFRLWV
jgi:hypothetical protein